MMRLVFLLAAEERGLLLLGEPRYDSFYAVSTLRMQLRAESDEILERRRSAWSRLLAVFRAVFGGIDHPTLRLPAMGGSLFDPDRFPFLEDGSRALLAPVSRGTAAHPTTARYCCSSKPSRPSRGARSPTARSTSNRSATCTRACSNAPSRASRT
jgi:hypothetical protein